MLKLLLERFLSLIVVLGTLLQLKDENTNVILDDYRKEAIELLRDNADTFHR